MSERPILFSAPMVRAILAGTKTQTRRVIVQPPKWRGRFDILSTDVLAPPDVWWWDGTHDRVGASQRCPYGAAGDTLWVRESIHLKERWNEGREDRALSVYSADDEPTPADCWPWKRNNLPSIHCPRGLSRIDLRVESVRVERVKDITEADAKAEGAEPADCCLAHYHGFAKLWESINGPRGYGWDANPWVWVVNFARI